MAKKITQNVNKDKFFNDLPKVSPEMSKWLSRHTNYQTCNAGQIVPIYYEEVLPRERKKLTLGMISHTTTPVAPIFNAMYTEIRTFFVPMRLCADLFNGYSTRKSPWVKVFGEDNANTSSAVVVALDQQKLPNFANGWLSAFPAAVENLTNRFQSVFDSLDLLNLKDVSKCNYLNLAAYELIYQRHYRNENYESATESKLYRALFDAYHANYSISLSGFSFEVANREKDYFTGAKPFTQKAENPVSMTLNGEGFLRAFNTDESSDPSSGTQITLSLGDKKAGSNPADYSVDAEANNDDGQVLELYSKISSSMSIEELRILIKTQELLEKDMMYGSRYAESLNAHFGTCPLDTTLQDPAELYRTTITSNMQAIFQTSSTSGESSILGTIGANSTTQTDPFVILPETEFKEHGILMVCAVHKLQNVYNSYYFKPKFLFKKSRFDFYTPELNDLGFQPLTADEMTAGTGVLGYNEAFAEYRYNYNKSHGLLNTTFPYWAPAIANSYTEISSLYKEDPLVLDLALSVASTTAPQFYDAWGFEEECTKPMSLHSIPGFDGVI